jgi:hypothetical protein
MVAAVAAHAVDQDVQVDILMSKIINAQKEGRAADALPSMAKLESMEPTLKAPLSEGFHFLYITTLDETGDHANALRRANVYIEKFGMGGKNYAKVVDIIGRLEEEADKVAQAESARIAAEKVENERKCMESKIRYCRTLQAGLDAWNVDRDNRRSHELRDEAHEIEQEANRNNCKWAHIVGLSHCVLADGSVF